MDRDSVVKETTLAAYLKEKLTSLRVKHLGIQGYKGLNVHEVANRGRC